MSNYVLGSTVLRRRVLSPGWTTWKMSSGVGQWCFTTLHCGLTEIFNLLLELGLRLLYKLDMLMFIIMVIISIIFECLLCTRCCASCFTYIISSAAAALCSGGVVTCALLIKRPGIFSGPMSGERSSPALRRGRWARLAFLVLWLQSSLFCCSPRMFVCGLLLS